jgi:predicted Zn-dependent peptidase
MRKKYLQLILIIAVTIFFQASAFSLERVHPSDLTYKPIKLNPPVPDKTVLKNGMVIYTLEDHELPIFAINAVIKTGAIYVPEEKAGLASITGSVMRSGGTKNMTWEEIDEKLEFIAGSVETLIGSDSGSASLSVMIKDIDEGLKIFADVLMHPVFAQEKIDIIKNQAIEAIRRENDNPGQVARREFRRLLYRDHPYGHKSTIESVSSITREGIIAFHKKYYHPNNIMFAISGDFNKEEILDKIRSVFKDWKKEKIDFPEVPPVKKDLNRSVNYIYKDVKQSVIRLGHMGIDYRNLDHYAVILMNYILGGGSFQSRMMQDIRNDRACLLSMELFSVRYAGYRSLRVRVWH